MDSVSAEASSTVNESSSHGFLQIMLTEETSCDDLLNKWLSETGDNWKARKRHIVEFMFLSSGCDSFSYDLFLSDDISSYLSSKQLIPNTPPAMNDSFLEKYCVLVKRIFFHDDLMENEGGIEFLQTVATAVSYLCVSPWDSCRTIAACTGLKLLTFYHSMNQVIEDKMEKASSEHNSNLVDELSAQKLKVFNLWLALFKSFFVKAVRDVVPYIRELVFIEMAEWAEISSSLLISLHWHKFIVFGLHDKFQCCRHAMNVLKTLLDRSYNVTYQQMLLDKALRRLVGRLNEKGSIGVTAITILASAARFLEVKCSPVELSSIYMCVYDPNKVIAIHAAKYIFVTKLQESIHRPETLLHEIVIFNAEALISSEELLVDSFYYITKEYVSWEHWPLLFNIGHPELTLSSVKLYINYVKKATTNYCPKQRNKNILPISKNDMILAANSFTSFISENWKKIVSIDKIKYNPHAFGLIIFSMRHCNRSLSPDVASDIVEYLVRWIMNSQSPIIVSCCWSTLAFLCRNVIWDSPTRHRTRAKLDSLKCQILKEFGEFLTFPSSFPNWTCVETKILGLAKYDDSDLTHLWDSCINTLEKLLNDSLDGLLIKIIVKTLRNLLFHQYEYYDNKAILSLNESANSDSSNATPHWVHDISELMAQQSALTLLLVQLLDDKHSMFNRLLAFEVLVDVVKGFGPHMVHHPILWPLADPIDPEIQSKMISLACSAMNWNYSHKEDQFAHCCDVLEKIGELFSMAYIDILMLKDLLVLTGKNKLHDKIILSSFKSYVDNFSKKYITISLVIFKTLVMKIKEPLTAITNQSTNNENLIASIIKNTFDQWLVQSGFSTVICSPGVLSTLEFCFEELFKSLNAPHPFVAGTFFKSLISERPTMTEVQAVPQETNSNSDEIEESLDYSVFAGKEGIGHSTFHQVKNTGITSGLDISSVSEN